ncbi:amino acid transporter [Penicillium canariense]|uniref:Amino acid transporter n=1 Tax=Penicillium canariense TaxID=189055 RepID=A0A9W9IGC6_9EURO|nr:amino acid transporter [Penicillium canariense]KAJ5176700.1 amino acid transporter [Penicillium canariense]
MSKLGSLALDGGDPRLHEKEHENMDILAANDMSSGIRPQHRRLHDPTVTFEEYYHYAQKTREEEDTFGGKETGIMSIFFPSKNDSGVQQIAENGSKDATQINTTDEASRMMVTDEEWTNASRALRTATRGAIFYLITTDILGPFGLPYAVASMGWGPGIALYTVFAGLAGYSGYLLWVTFMGLDSYQFPIHSFGDIGFRLYGPWLRYLFNILQSIQLLLNVGLIVMGNGMALSQVAKFKVCFIVCCVIWAAAGFALGQVRTLQKFGWLANVAVWLNLLCMFVSMGGAAHSDPNYSAHNQAAGASFGDGSSVQPNPLTGAWPAVHTSGGLPDPSNFIGTVSGAMQAVFAYGGSMIFPEFMAEMKRPRDFLTAMWAAQAFIYVTYMLYGLFIYGYQGQYTVNPAYLGVSKYGLQTAGNVMAMVTGLIAGGLYGNIGVKVIYNNIFVEMFHAPPLTHRAGKFLWVAIIPVYWGIAFILAASIPSFGGLTAVVAAFCILHFTYSFPPMLATLFWIKEAALQEGEGFDPATGNTIRHDSGIKRLVRGCMSLKPKILMMSVFNVFYFLGALALAGLGAYSAIEVLKDAYKGKVSTAFTCHSPLDG